MSIGPIAPAYRIQTERLVLRCFEPGDASLLKEAIDGSLDHLVPWLPWARDEPQSIDTKLELLRQFRGRFDLGKDFTYGIFAPDEAEVIGACASHPRVGPEARELGYWIARKHTGCGLATEAAAALVRVGFELEKLERIEIHSDPENVRSLAIAKKLGFQEDGTLRQRLRRSDGTLGPRCIFSMMAAEYPGSPCAQARIEAFDAIGRRSLELPTDRSTRRRSAFR